jgi:hypothetical protein
MSAPGRSTCASTNTQADLSLENEIRELGAGGGQPPVTHLIEVDGQASPRP